MGTIFDIWSIGLIVTLIAGGGCCLVAAMNGAMEGWRRFDFQFAFAALAGFLSAPAWPVTIAVLLVFLYRRAFPKPTAEDLDERIRRAEREAGIA